MIFSIASLRFKGALVSIEIDISHSIPGFEIVGLPSSEVREAKDRVKIAIKNSGYVWPSKKILVNLSPADIKKRGSGFDLPIALAILRETNQISPFNFPVMAMGELQLDGKIRPMRGVLSASIVSIEQGVENFIVLKENTPEYCAIKQGRYLLVSHLSDFRNTYVWGDLSEKHVIGKEHSIPKLDETNDGRDIETIADLSYCDAFKRVLQVASAGRHNLLLSGPPGTGKTAGALRMRSLLPPLDYHDSLEISGLYSQSGYQFSGNHLIQHYPVRIPHHTASVEGIVGSSNHYSLGEISLAHLGILILDEAPEFKTKVLQALREPVDNHYVLISRAGQKWSCPADFQLVLTSNLCPCGNLGRPDNAGVWCLCSEREIFRYWKRIGGALWDRIDIKFRTHTRVIDQEEDILICIKDLKEKKAQVCTAIEIQKERFAQMKLSYRWNARCPSEFLSCMCVFTKKAKSVLHNAIRTHGISERSKNALYRVSRTIADLHESTEIHSMHVDETIELVTTSQTMSSLIAKER